MNFNTNSTPIIITILIAVAGIYWYFFTGTGNQPPISAEGSVNQAQTTFRTLVGQLTPISFNTDIFSDARFNALVDITVPITSEPIGRLDPFAVISGASGN